MNHQSHVNVNSLTFFDCCVLIRLKNAQKFTQQFIADNLNVHQSKVGRWESGSHIPDANELKALADLFGVEVNIFFTTNLPPPPEKQVDIFIFNLLGRFV